MIPITQYQRTAHLVDQSGAAARLDELLYPNAQGRRGLPTRTFLIGGLLTIQLERSMRYRDIYHVLTRRLPPEAMLDLGVAEMLVDDSGQRIARTTLSEHRVYAYSRRLRDMVGGQGPITDEVRALLLDVVHRIIDAGLPSRPAGSTGYALDESGMWAYSRGLFPGTLEDEPVDPDDQVPGLEELLDEEVETPTDNDAGQPEAATFTSPSSRPSSVDPDAAAGGKTAKNGKKETYFGYGLQGLIRAPALGLDGESEPLLIERLDLTPASTDIVAPSLAMIDALLSKPNGRIEELLVDRHYSYKKVDRWYTELVARGIRQVLDLHPNDHGFRPVDGMRVAAGWPHCPATPDHLGTIVRPSPPGSKPPKSAGTPGATAAERQAAEEETAERRAAHLRRRETFDQRISERSAYAMERRSGIGGDKIRYGCPALNGTAGCALRPGTMEAAEQLCLPTVDNPPDLATAPASCTQDTVTVKLDPEHGMNPKLVQQHYWGSEDWEGSFKRRTYVEGFFGTLKDAATENISREGSRGDRLGLRLLYVGLGIACTNLRLLRKWHATQGGDLDVDPILLAPDVYPTEFPLGDDGQQAA